MASQVRAVGVEAFEEIYPLLQQFPTATMSKDDWRKMLFDYRWSDNPQRGFALYDGGKAVGFLGTIFSNRMLAGQLEPVCSLSSWIVLPEHRDRSLSLVMPILKLKDHTILNPTPSPVAYGIFSKLGFLELEKERLILPPMPGVFDAVRSLAGSFTRSPDELRKELTGEQRSLYEHHAECRVAQHALLRHRGRSCYLVATPIHRRGLPFAEIQYVSDPDFFWQYLALAWAALARSTRAVGLWVDRRLAGARRLPLGLRWPSRRLYRPRRKEIAPEMIDGLYSELMGLRW